MLKWWTISRASGTGVTAGLAALLLWPAYAAWQDPLRAAYVAALALTAFCGVSILVITAADILRHRRGRRLRPVRAFDVLLAILLALPSLLALDALLT
ncbi:MAG TPA: hypothetical protein VGW34_12900 [Allosphingosinicella sp.]|nr:hypothetical protein [Allosphingosinicella sp.]